MGQTLGRAPLPQSCRRFINLPKSCVYDLWEAFNDIAEGFGLTIEEFQEIIKSALMEYLGITEKMLNVDTDSVFRVFDSDENNLVDSLEFLSSFSLLSGMTPEEKIRFIFAMYDFDESAVLSLDEMVLAFRSTLSGLSKLSHIDPPSEAEVEVIVVQGFDILQKSKRGIDATSEFGGIDKESFVNYCLNTPEIMSWIDFFDDLEEYGNEISSRTPTLLLKASHLDRNVKQTAVIDVADGGLYRLEWERKGPAKDYLPRQAWQNVVPFLAPTRQPDPVRDLPPHNIRLEWSYGYNAHSSRQSVYYSAKGLIIYPVAAVCVIYDTVLQTQRHFTGHNDLVICLKAYHSHSDGRTVVASGECGRVPAIHIWDCDTKKVLSTLKGFHRNGVAQLDFSPDRTKLATLGMDPYHSIAVYAWESRERIWSARSTADPVHDLRFLTNSLVGSCGKDHVYFWSQSKTGYRRYRGLFGNAVKPETLWCIAAVGDTIITGSDSGKLHVWEGRNLVNSIKGHTGPVLSCFLLQNGDNGDSGLVTACSSGKIQIWNSKLEIGATFNAGALGSMDPAIFSVCFDSITQKMLVGFKSCEIYEMDSSDGRNLHNTSIVAAHFGPKIHGLSVHPMNPRVVCTVGDDRSIRIFDAELRKQLRVAMLDTMGHCCSFSPNGQEILVGLGSGIEGREERKEGAYVILSEEDLTVVQEARDSKQALASCKYSPNGELFALGSFDGCIYVYNSRDYSMKSKCRGHTGKILNIDFSHDGHYIMSNSSTGELLFWDADRGDLQAPKQVKDFQWETNSCVFSYATQGFWGPYDDSAVCSAACRSHARDLQAVVDNCGRLRVCSAPCVRDDPNYLTCSGHAANASRCEFSCDDSYLFSCGGGDGAILQWKVSLPEVQDYEDMKRDQSLSEVLAAEASFDGRSIIHGASFEDVMNDQPIAKCEMEEGLVDVNQLQPWQRTIVAPSRVPFEDTSEPPDNLQLEFVYGFTCDRSRQSLFYAPGGEALFFAGSIAILMDQRKRTQRFYSDHATAITAMAVDNRNHLIATGDLGDAPTIRIWHPVTLMTMAVLHGYHRRSIAHLKFSADGNQLVSVGQDRFHSIAIYDWRNRQILSHTRGFLNKSLAIDFNPAATELVQCGDGIIRFWEIEGRNVCYQDALLGTRAKLQGFLCISWIGNNAVVGTLDGNLYRFVGRQLDGMVQAHTGPINALEGSSDGLCSCSNDGFVKIWTRILECRLVVDSKNLPVSSRILKCVTWDSALGRLLIGTSFGEIVEVSSGDGENLHSGSLLQGHGGEELWGLAVNPVKDEFCTVGDDAILRVWDTVTHTSVSLFQLEMPARCCAFSPDGSNIAVGYGSANAKPTSTGKQFDGKWIVLSSEDFQVIHEARDSTKWLTDSKFSPNGELLAFGSADFKIYIYNVTDSYSLAAVVSQHHAQITSIDFSEDSHWLQSNCAAFELCFFEADSGLYIPAASRLRDTVWSTQNCPLGWAVQGIWPAYRDGTECTACECNLFRGEDGAVVVAGDNYGRIEMFRYPCTSSSSNRKLYRTSSSPVTRLRFGSGDAVLLSIASMDKVIMQWSHVRDRSAEVAWNVLDRRGVVEEDEDDILRTFGLVAVEEALPDLKELNNLVSSSRPWVASMVPPSNASKDPILTAPDVVLEKAHIFGVQSDVTKSSVRFNVAGDIVFPSSKYVCVYSKKKNGQMYYEGHTGRSEISCVVVSRDGKLAASGERCNRPRIHVWDASTCETICVLQLFHRRGVISMQFSVDRHLLVSIGMDQEHSIALWQSCTGDWTDGKLLACAQSDINPSTFCAFYDTSATGLVLASGGRFNQKFWRQNGRCLNPCYPEYDNKQKIGTLLCGTTVGKTFVSGSTSGHLFVWVERKLNRVVRAHELGVSCIWSSPCGAITGSKDGVIKQWSLDLEHMHTFSLSDADIPPVLSCLRSIDASLTLEDDAIARILATTAGGEIYEIAARSGSTSLVHEAHNSGELWGLCTHPTDPDVFVTCGDDKTVRVWSISHRRLLRKAVLDCTARSVAWSHDGKHIILGLGGSWDGKRQRKDGAFILLEAATLRPIFEGRDSRHWLQDVKFSPDGQSFAVASMDHKIYIYHRESFRLKGTCDRHNSFIKTFDFSVDSTYIQSDSGDFEHLYFEAEDGEHFAAGSQLKDIQWADWTCSYGWPVQGVWPYFDDIDKKKAYEPSSVHRSYDETAVAVGDQGGFVKLFSYPCVSKDALYVGQDAHVNEISKVRFTCDNSHLITIGRQDRAIIVWKVLPPYSKKTGRVVAAPSVGSNDR